MDNMATVQQDRQPFFIFYISLTAISSSSRKSYFLWICMVSSIFSPRSAGLFLISSSFCSVQTISMWTGQTFSLLQGLKVVMVCQRQVRLFRPQFWSPCRQVNQRMRNLSVANLAKKLGPISAISSSSMSLISISISMVFLGNISAAEGCTLQWVGLLLSTLKLMQWELLQFRSTRSRLQREQVSALLQQKVMGQLVFCPINLRLEPGLRMSSWMRLSKREVFLEERSLLSVLGCWRWVISYIIDICSQYQWSCYHYSVWQQCRQVLLICTGVSSARQLSSDSYRFRQLLDCLDMVRIFFEPLCRGLVYSFLQQQTNAWVVGRALVRLWRKRLRLLNLSVMPTKLCFLSLSPISRLQVGGLECLGLQRGSLGSCSFILCGSFFFGVQKRRAFYSYFTLGESSERLISGLSFSSSGIIQILGATERCCSIARGSRGLSTLGSGIGGPISNCLVMVRLSNLHSYSFFFAVLSVDGSVHFYSGLQGSYAI